LGHTGKLSCFLAGISTFFPRSIPSARAEPPPGRARHDHLVDVAALGGDEASGSSDDHCPPLFRDRKSRDAERPAAGFHDPRRRGASPARINPPSNPIVKPWGFISDSGQPFG
jgi:hypothetical protein